MEATRFISKLQMLLLFQSARGQKTRATHVFSASMVGYREVQTTAQGGKNIVPYHELFVSI